MIKIIYIPNKLLDSTFSRELFRREIERKEGFRVIEVNLDIEKALSAASVSGPDVLIISPAEQENKFNEQIESVVSFRRANPGSCPPDALILSNRISEYAARRLSDADMMYQFVKPLDPYELADKLERVYISGFKRAGQDSEKSRFAGRLKDLLVGMEIYPSYTGFRYLVDAVMMVRYSPDSPALSKEIYPKIGAKYGKSELSVERAIRLLASVAWNNTEWKRRFPSFGKRPSNSEFIFLLADYLSAGAVS